MNGFRISHLPSGDKLPGFGPGRTSVEKRARELGKGVEVDVVSKGRNAVDDGLDLSV